MQAVMLATGPGCNFAHFYIQMHKQASSQKMQTYNIVAQGGGMTTSYHAGVVKALEEKYGLEGIKNIFCTSGAAAVYTYVASKQTELITPIWEYLLKSKKFSRPWAFPPGKGAMDIDFLVDQVIKQRFKLNLKKLHASTVLLNIGVTNALTGKPKYFTQNQNIDIFELLRASCAVPYFARPAVKIGSELYCDGTIGSPSSLEEIDEENNVLIVLIRDKSRNYPLPLRKIAASLILKNEPPGLSQAIWNMVSKYNNIPAQITKLKQQKRNIAVLSPSRDLPIKRVDTSYRNLMETIELGYHDTINNHDLENFFNALN